MSFDPDCFTGFGTPIRHPLRRSVRLHRPGFPAEKILTDQDI
jgi:hypothetical protein